MNLLILGATGPTGRHVVELAVRHGDAVTVLARDPATLGGLAGQVAVIAGDATSRDDVAKALVGADVVVSALGRGASMRAGGLFSRAAQAVTGAAGDSGGVCFFLREIAEKSLASGDAVPATSGAPWCHR